MAGQARGSGEEVGGAVDAVSDIIETAITDLAGDGCFDVKVLGENPSRSGSAADLDRRRCIDLDQAGGLGGALAKVFGDPHRTELGAAH